MATKTTNNNKSNKKKGASKLKKVVRLFNPRSLKGGVALFALVFAFAGGGYYVYRSFAASGSTNSHTCMINVDTYVYCWGLNRYGQLGNGTKTNSLAYVKTSIGDARQVSGGNVSTCSVKNDNTLWCWGANSEGQLGIGTLTDQIKPKQVMTNVRQVSSGYWHTCATKHDSTLWCWGNNDNGKLGIGNRINQSLPRQVMTNVQEVSSGEEHTCAIKTNGYLYCWGDNSSGQLGIGNWSYGTNKPTLTSTKNAITVTSGAWHTCAVTTSLNLWCWGANSVGQLGIGNYADQNVSKLVVGFQGTASLANAAGAAHTCAIKSSDKQLYCWGSDYTGEQGRGWSAWSNTPLKTPFSTNAAYRVTAGGNNTCAIDVKGYTYCWGDNTYGQLGLGNTYYQNGHPALLFFAAQK